MTKTITLSDEVYEMLLKAKLEKESFSDVIARLIKKKKISDIPRVLTDDEAEKIKKIIEKQRKFDIARIEELL